MTETRQQRRASARLGGSSRGFAPRRLVAAAMALSVVAAGVWYWRAGRERDAVRDGAPAWTPDGRQIVYYSEDKGRADLFIADRTGENRRPLTRTPADEGGPAVSPDGRWIAFDADPDGNFEIYVMRVDGTGVRRLTRDPARDLAPAWSPDGRHIVFMSTRDNPEFDVYRMDAEDGGRVERLTQGSSNWFPQYSPDGTRIAMHVMRDVHVLELGSRAVQRLTEEPMNGMYPTWSPDGRRIAFMSWRNGRTEIFTANADGSDQQVLVSMPEGDAVDPRWSPAGDAIVFVHVPAGGLAGPQSPGQERILYTVDLATRAVARVSR